VNRLAHMLLFCGFLLSAVEAQSVYLGVGGGFSTMSPKDNYAFVYATDRTSWPGKFEEMVGQKADVGFTIASSMQFRLPDTAVSLTAGVSYTQFYGKCDYVKAYTPPWYSSIYTIGELTTRSNMLTFSTGVQWQIIQSPVAPYVSLDLLYNIIGDTKLRISSTSSTTEAIVDGNTRMGLSVGGGARLALLPSIALAVGANYTWINLITPECDEKTRGAIGLTISVLHRLL
jgi:hypothetical protein